MYIDVRFWRPRTTRLVDRVLGQLAQVEPARLEGTRRRLDLLLDALRSGNTSYVRSQLGQLQHYLADGDGLADLVTQVEALAQSALDKTDATVVQTGAQSDTMIAGGLSARPVQPAPAGRPLNGSVNAYSISSSTLAYCHAYLTQHLPGAGVEPEWMLAVTGLRQDHLQTLEELIEVRLAAQSYGQASFDMSDFLRVALTLQEHGQALHAIFHSHRFAGPPSPSGTDRRLQKVLEEGGYPAIQAVFSEDGYVRFFSNERPFTTQVHGKGVQSIEPKQHLYRLVHFGTLPHPPDLRDQRRNGVRPLRADPGR
jgi:proteasome lid subunit RPN8/RPN11